MGSWLREIRTNAEKYAKIILVGNKNDLASER